MLRVCLLTRFSHRPTLCRQVTMNEIFNEAIRCELWAFCFRFFFSRFEPRVGQWMVSIKSNAISFLASNDKCTWCETQYRVCSCSLRIRWFIWRAKLRCEKRRRRNFDRSVRIVLLQPLHRRKNGTVIYSQLCSSEARSLAPFATKSHESLSETKCNHFYAIVYTFSGERKNSVETHH